MSNAERIEKLTVGTVTGETALLATGLVEQEDDAGARCNLVGPSLSLWDIRQFWGRVKDSWDDYQSGDDPRWIWRFWWKRYRR
ncbi:hypothetical protein MHEL_00630 [Mycolicibacterium helvum]|uniref:Uncharacterized protein n=1 Tax=Mycolicibacterium helvum TaxID=1534349 RepID=A0A7I7SYT9_9MYCO|nr:hypothetical protein MHEL_00630 [Mycolicibacterium helvum]